MLFRGIEHRVCGGSCAVNSVADKAIHNGFDQSQILIHIQIMLDMMRDDKSRCEQLLCQMPDEEAVTHQIGSTLSGTWIPPDGMGESIGTGKVREVYICKSII